MNPKVLLVVFCSALLAAGIGNAGAEELNWSGKWQIPELQGQGIDIAEYSDGAVIAHYYGYQDDGNQLWLIAVGKREEDQAVLEAWITQDGNDGEMDAPHTEIEWGTLELIEEDGALKMSAYPLDQPGWTHSLHPLYVPAPVEEPDPAPAEEPDPAPAEEPDPAPVEEPDPASVVQPDPPPVEEPDPAPDERPAATIRIETPLHTLSGIRWIEQPGQKLVSMTALPAEIRITVLEGKLTISGTYAAGPHHPKLTGVRSGQVLQAGQTVTVRCDVDANKRQQQSGNYGQADFGVYTSELGQILQLSAHVAE